MSNILTQPEQFKVELKNKWLDYYQANRGWLQNYMNQNKGWSDSVSYSQEILNSLEVEEEYEPRRPECYFILGVVSVLEPSIKDIFVFADNFTNNSEQIIRALGLNFDPELELKKRSQQENKQKIQTDLQHPERIREKIKHDFS